MNDGEMAMSFFMDMETLGTKENAIILSIGTLFIPPLKRIDNLPWSAIKREYGKKYVLDVDEQESTYGRSMDVSTVKWWMTKNPEVLKNQFNDPVQMSVEDAFDDITSNLEYCDFSIKSIRGESNLIWSRGLFEAKLWESLAKDLEKENIISYWQWRDTRTACSVISHDKNCGVEKMEGLNAHDPLDDCVLDFIRLNKLGII